MKRKKHIALNITKLGQVFKSILGRSTQHVKTIQHNTQTYTILLNILHLKKKKAEENNWICLILKIKMVRKIYSLFSCAHYSYHFFRFCFR